MGAGERRPGSLREAVRGVIGHQIGWIEANAERARFVYAHGNLDWSSPAGAQLGRLNRKLSDAYLQWMEPLMQAGQVRPVPMIVVNAVVAGPTHAIARQWLAEQASGPLHSYLDQLTDAATAALSGTRHQRQAPARRGRMQLQLVGDDGCVIAEGEAAVEFLPRQAGPE